MKRGIFPPRPTPRTRRLHFFLLCLLLSITYDLNTVFLLLQFTRVVLSWVASLAVCLAAPGLIGVSEAERAALLHPKAVVGKVAGTVLVCTAVYIMQG